MSNGEDSEEEPPSLILVNDRLIKTRAPLFLTN